MATEPVRLRLSRRAGFRLQEFSRAFNGLPATNVARPSVWGNPYKPDISPDGIEWTVEDCVAAFRDWIKSTQHFAALDDLRGRNLACWCKPGSPCHADVLLDLANAPRCEAMP